MTTLADVNATLGVTNIALAGVSKNTEETNKGIESFLDYLKDKEADDNRRELEARREAKASALKTGLAATGSGIASAGRGALGLGKSLFAGLGNLIPPALGAGFLASMLSSKLFRFGIPGLGLLFGDEIANFLTGPDATKGFKDAVAGAIKGGSIGFLFGKKGFLLGTALGALLTNDKVDTQLGNLKNNIEDLTKKLFGLDKDSLAGALKIVADGIGERIKNLNSVLKGDFDSKSLIGSLELLAGAAFLISPRGSAKLALAATAALSRSPAGKALLTLSALGLIRRYVFSGGEENINQAEEFATTSETYNKKKAEEEGNSFFAPLKEFYQQFKFIIDTLLEFGALFLGFKVFKSLGNLRNVFSRSPKPNVSAPSGSTSRGAPNIKPGSNPMMDAFDDAYGKDKQSGLRKFLNRSFRFLNNAKNFGIRFLKNGTPLVVPLTAADILIEGEEMRGFNRRIYENAVREFGVGGIRKGDLFNVFDYDKIKAGLVDDFRGINNLQSTNRLLEAMNLYNNQSNSPGALGGSTTIANSGNTNTTNVGNQIVTQDGVSDKKIFEAFKSDTSGIL